MKSSKDKKQHREQAPVAPEQEADDVSFGLDALGELRDQEQQAPGQADHAGTPPAGADGASGPAADDEEEPKLKSALDRYKNWLTSMK